MRAFAPASLKEKNGSPCRLIRKAPALTEYKGYEAQTSYPLHVVQRKGLEPPAEYQAFSLQGLTVIKRFGEGSHAYLVEKSGKEYVLKLSSENAQAEVKTGLLAKKLAVPAVDGGLITYTQEDVVQLPQIVKGDKQTVEQMQEKMAGEVARNEEKTAFAIIMEYAQGKSLSSHLGLGDEQQTIPKGGTKTLLTKLIEAGKLQTFFSDLGQIAAFDIIVGNKDRFAFESKTHSLYQGGLPKGNTGNILLTNTFTATSIDMDIGVALGTLDQPTIAALQEAFQEYIEALKKKDFTKIIHAVLTAVSESEEDVDEIVGELATVPDAEKWISFGIDLVLQKIQSLKDEDLQAVVETWEANAKDYGRYLLYVMKEIRG